ncbi:MAG: penicillin-binding protein 1C [Acidobacteria bacterium]|nr:penicillin-binding protein 1C [Acidobacteriota bacterium]MDW7983942.1 penicillin-binding protein 1C [Acidobacteriota bacterium]
MRMVCRWWLVLGALFASIVSALPFLIPLPPRIEVPSSQVVFDRHGRVLRIFLTSDEKWRVETRLDEIDPLLVQATICFEDRAFWFHPGVNPLAVVRAAWQNLRAGRIVSGGSTLPMQLARIVEPRPRTWRSKLIEVLRAFQYELRLGKRRILELYLNRAPYGGNLEGVTAASLAYFGRLPRQLTPAQVAFLVSLPQAPVSRFLLRAAPSEVIKAHHRVLARMRACGLLSEGAYRSALGEDIPTGLRPMPAQALHATDYLRALFPDVPHIRSTLDADVQRTVESLVQAYRPVVYRSGATQVSVVVIENSTRKVRALVGSVDYWDEAHDGQVPGFLALRSPGSALKPFLYALALQEGVITTETLLEDYPTPIRGYRPINFSGTFRGLVRAEEALAHSLNVPFVHLLRRTGFRDFMRLLERGGIHVRSGRDYGLSVITGALEVRLLDLTNLYVTLARDGWHGPPVLVEDTPSFETQRRLLHPGAVVLTRRALALRDRPDAPHLRSVTPPRATVYWKTGTSWGRRDAWSVGFHAGYTVGVWVGNFSGEGAEGIVGGELAAPLMFDILNALPAPSQELRPPPDADLTRVPVCPFSGERPKEACPGVRWVLAVRDAAPLRACPYHRRLLVERDSGRRMCPWKSYASGELTAQVFTLLPPLAAAFLGTPTSTEPLPSEQCATPEVLSEMRILSPLEGATYLPSADVRGSGGIPLRAVTPAPDRRIFWFVNDQFVGSTVSGEVWLVHLSPGPVTVVAVDSTGRSDRVHLQVLSP